MSNITYRPVKALGLREDVRVYLGRQRAGTIVKKPEGFVYVPWGYTRHDTRHCGGPLPTLDLVKATLEFTKPC